MRPDRVVLWGFMACGKSAVGRRLARRLGWSFLDLDEEIVRRTGRTVAQIFERDGEPAFRAREVELTREIAARDHLVFAPGGGWITNPDVLGLLPPRTLSVWLRISAETALARVRFHSGAPVRPLLRSPDPEATARRLLRDREPLYAQADATVDADGCTLDEVVSRVERIVRSRAAGEELSQ
ncbi:MAG TPA: shikimate kinase [Longimicrobiaceae bacterium]|nr:shikimate kinase [Longimicrobiaceae bacterium]